MAMFALQARTQPITTKSKVNSDQLYRWLHSGDSRLIAWAAYFAVQHHDAAVLAEMPDWVERLDGIEIDRRGSAGAEARNAVKAVLDAVIVSGGRLPIQGVERIEEQFPSQAAILIARLDLADSRATLERWTQGTTLHREPDPAGAKSRRPMQRNVLDAQLARIAAMLLAKDPDDAQKFACDQTHTAIGFAACLVASSEEQLMITVADGEVGWGVGGADCGGSWLALLPAPGWPPIYDYDLAENDPDMHSTAIVNLDGDRISYHRYLQSDPLGPGFRVEALDGNTRHKLLAYWLGVPDEKMPWQPIVRHTIRWTDTPTVRAAIAQDTADEKAKLAETVAALAERGIVTREEAGAVSPQLAVDVQCMISPCPLKK